MCCEKYFTALNSTTHQNYFPTEVQYQLAYKKMKKHSICTWFLVATQKDVPYYTHSLLDYVCFFPIKTWWYHGCCSLISVESERPVWTVLTYETCGRTILWIKFKVRLKSRSPTDVDQGEDMFGDDSVFGLFQPSNLCTTWVPRWTGHRIYLLTLHNFIDEMPSTLHIT